MLSKDEYFLQAYVHGVIANHVIRFCSDHWIIKRVVYKKIKYLKAYGFVDWDFKNPNTIANKRKEKITDLQVEIKELREFKKNAERYFKYNLKIENNEKLTKAQRQWYFEYMEKIKQEIED